MIRRKKPPPVLNLPTEAWNLLICTQEDFSIGFLKNSQCGFSWVKSVEDRNELMAAYTIIRQALTDNTKLLILPVKSFVRRALIDPSKSNWRQDFTALRIRKLLKGVDCCACHILDRGYSSDEAGSCSSSLRLQLLFAWPKLWVLFYEHCFDPSSFSLVCRFFSFLLCERISRWVQLLSIANLFLEQKLNGALPNFLVHCTLFFWNIFFLPSKKDLFPIMCFCHFIHRIKH